MNTHFPPMNGPSITGRLDRGVQAFRLARVVNCLSNVALLVGWGLALFLRTVPLARGASEPAAESFTSWVDRVPPDNALVEGRSVVVAMPAMQGWAVTSKPGEAFFNSVAAAEGKYTQVIVWVDGQAKTIRELPLPAYPRLLSLSRRVEAAPNGNRTLWFEVARENIHERLPAVVSVELDPKGGPLAIKEHGVNEALWKAHCEIASFADLPATGQLQNAYFIPMASDEVRWPTALPLHLLSASFEGQRKMYVLQEDRLAAVRPLWLMPLGRLMFLRSGRQVVFKLWANVATAKFGADQVESRGPVCTATWTLDADEVYNAYRVTGDWLLVEIRRGNERVCALYDMPSILQHEARKIADDGSARW